MLEDTKDKRAIQYKCNINLDNKNSSQTIIFSYVSESSKVLDVGCACRDLGFLLATKKNCKVWGIEYCEESANVAKNTNAFVDVFHIDLNLFDKSMFKAFYNFFDYIILGDVLEHLYDPEKAIENLKYLLKESGNLIISLPNIAHSSIKASLLMNEFNYTDIGLLDKSHIRFFTYKNMVELFAKENLQIESVNFTIFGINHGIEKDPYQMLPKNILRFILSDYHSYVYQYVFKTKISELSYDELKAHNFIIIDNTLNKKPHELKYQIKKAKKKLFPLYFYIKKLFK